MPTALTSPKRTGQFTVGIPELYIDKRNQHRYYVSVSQQNIGYKSAKTGNPLGAWFFCCLN